MEELHLWLTVEEKAALAADVAREASVPLKLNSVAINIVEKAQTERSPHRWFSPHRSTVNTHLSSWCGLSQGKEKTPYSTRKIQKSRDTWAGFEIRESRTQHLNKAPDEDPRNTKAICPYTKAVVYPSK